MVKWHLPQAQLLFYVPDQFFVDLGMPWNRLPPSRFRIEVNIMSCTVPQQNTSLFCKLADKLSPLHIAISLIAYSLGTSSIAIKR